jgi:hypothetical protein
MKRKLMLGGLGFPMIDELPGQREAHGPIMLWLMRVHPIAMWLVAILVGLVIGFLK